MKAFIRSQISSAAASASDFAMMIFLVEVLQCPIVMAGVAGSVAGAAVNFITGRNWVFDPSNKGIGIQALKYTMVWCGYLILTAAGLMILSHLASVNYVISKAVIGVILGFTYNFLLQKKFVFA